MPIDNCVCLMDPVMVKNCNKVTWWCAQLSKNNPSTVNSSMSNNFHDHSQGFAGGGLVSYPDPQAYPTKVGLVAIRHSAQLYGAIIPDDSTMCNQHAQ